MHPRGALFGAVLLIAGAACRSDSTRSPCPPGETACRDYPAPVRCTPGQKAACYCSLYSYQHHSPPHRPNGEETCEADGLWSSCRCTNGDEPADTGGKSGYATGGRGGRGGPVGTGGSGAEGGPDGAADAAGGSDGAVDGVEERQ